MVKIAGFFCLCCVVDARVLFSEPIMPTPGISGKHQRQSKKWINSGLFAKHRSGTFPKETFQELQTSLSKSDSESVSLIQKCPTISGGYRCSDAVVVANKLIAMGPKRASEIMSTYLDLVERHENRFDLCPYRVSLLCRLVFIADRKQKFLVDPIVYRNLPQIYTKSQDDLIPLFPIIMIDGLPFLFGEPSAVSVSAHRLAVARANFNHCKKALSFRKSEINIDIEKARQGLEKFLQSPSFEMLISDPNEGLTDLQIQVRKRRTARFMLSQINVNSKQSKKAREAENGYSCFRRFACLLPTPEG